MARVIDAKYSTLIGTPAKLRELLGILQGGGGASIVDLKFSNLVVLDKPLRSADLRTALESTPRATR